MKRVVIMGASSGIGLAVAEALASRGVKTGLAARHTKELHALKEKYPACVEYESIDVTHNDGPKKLEELIDKLGGMDIYFHVAGIGYSNPSLDPHREAEMIATNAGGFARMISAAYGYYRDNSRKGQIVALTSVAGTNGIGDMAAYSASKKCAQTYLVALEQLARKKKVDITFTDIRPGWIRTPLLDVDKSYPMEMTLDYVVPMIIRAIVKHPRVVYIDARWAALCSAWKAIPDAVWAKMNVSPAKKISLGNEDSAMVEVSVEAEKPIEPEVSVDIDTASPSDN
ncbi:MAG: SDR family NAD(P)-dependent oxidoreductase [Muribaculaceae bacterium]|nr:SDR family NAD(P)-dependent oxidoreductase [Muribaculaceae bacterium]